MSETIELSALTNEPEGPERPEVLPTPRFFLQVPKQRNRKGWKWIPRAVYFCLLVIAIVLAMVNKEEMEYKLKPRIKACLMLGISLIVAILVNAIKRTLIFFEERRQKEVRYDSSWTNLLAASCSKIHGGIILFFMVLTFLALIPVVYYNYASPWISILSAVGVGPLLVQLLHFDKCSDAEVSAIIEENRKGTGHTLAVDYHHEHLHGWRSTKNGNTFKRYILIPSDCNTMKRLDTVYGPIRYSGGKINCFIGDGPLRQLARYSTYSVDVGENRTRVPNVLLEYAIPLKTLYQMSSCEKYFGFIKENELIYETKMFYGTLKKILSKCQECQQNNVLVPYDPRELEESGLADLLYSLKVSPTEEECEQLSEEEGYGSKVSGL